MKLIVISYPSKIEGEENFIPHLLDNGLEFYHLRKPDFTTEQIIDLVNKIPVNYHPQIILHGHWELTNTFDFGGLHIREKDKIKIDFNRNTYHSISIHNPKELYLDYKGLQYSFLSPIFNSISKANYVAAYNLTELKNLFTKNHPKLPVYALGGINTEKIPIVKETGFDGVAVLGYIWNCYKEKGIKEAILNFKKLSNLCQ